MKSPVPSIIGNPVEFSIRHLAETVIELTGSSSTIVNQELPEDDPKQREPDIAKGAVGARLDSQSAIARRAH